MMPILAANSAAAKPGGALKTKCLLLPKAPTVGAALSFDDSGHPLHLKLSPVSGFTSKAIADWAKTNLAPGCDVLSDGLGR